MALPAPGWPENRGAPLAHTVRYAVDTVTPEDLQHIAQEYLRDEEMLLVVVGDRSQIADQPSAFGEVTEAAP